MRKEHLYYKGKDGKDYKDYETLARADEEWKRQNLFLIVNDVNEGRVEVHHGTERKICVGYLIEVEEDHLRVKHRRRDVPIYRTVRF